jgi:membrane-bound ClpP family serine protease
LVFGFDFGFWFLVFGLGTSGFRVPGISGFLEFRLTLLWIGTMGSTTAWSRNLI